MKEIDMCVAMYVQSINYLSVKQLLQFIQIFANNSNSDYYIICSIYNKLYIFYILSSGIFHNVV